VKPSDGISDFTGRERERENKDTESGGLQTMENSSLELNYAGTLTSYFQVPLLWKKLISVV
jgi:hypothetical protein